MRNEGSWSVYKGQVAIKEEIRAAAPRYLALTLQINLPKEFDAVYIVLVDCGDYLQGNSTAD